MFRQITRCRLCGNPNLTLIVSLGDQYLTGVFPRDPNQTLTRGPLELVKCHVDDDGNDDQHCGLVQLRHSYQPEEMYGENYGYRSSLNRAMVEHLHQKADGLARRANLKAGDIVLDIGSNDGTTLSFYPSDTMRVGIDPAGEKFRRYYPPDVRIIPEFFSADAFRSNMGPKAKARLVTSIAMFYDLEEPIAFAEQVRDVLADDGIWHLEQSYLPLMLRVNAYDTICHEHVEYYALRQIKWITDRVGLKIIDVSVNDVNGGSFAITAAKRDGPYEATDSLIDSMLASEKTIGLSRLEPYEHFRQNIERPKGELQRLLVRLKASGKRVLGYGASTKGNVILQYCGITTDLLSHIAEVNKDKFGSYTPGTTIPIISEAQARELKPDYYLVLPWHFRENLIKREAAFLAAGGKMIFPLPTLEIVGSGGIDRGGGVDGSKG